MNDEFLENKIFNTWLSDKRNTEWGEMTLRVTFIKTTHKSYFFQIEDIKNWGHLIVKLDNNDLFSQYLKQRFSPEMIHLFSKYNTSEPVASKDQKLFLEELNKLLCLSTLYNTKFFSGITLNPEIMHFMSKDSNKNKLIELNRLLLEKTFPNEIVKKVNQLRIESFFGDQTDPIVIEDSFVLIHSYLISPSWNKGVPINIGLQNNHLKLIIKNEEPLLLKCIQAIE